MLSFSVHPKVEDDVADIYEFISRQSGWNAMHVVDAIQSAIEKLKLPLRGGPLYQFRNPDLAAHPLLQNVRWICPQPRSRYRKFMIFYREDNEQTRILYVYHGSRDIEALVSKDIRD
ncbi:MAG: type II toxin-antitoxin system RelE/ParE family toxin [Verrucomicrobiota bacterium]